MNEPDQPNPDDLAKAEEELERLLLEGLNSGPATPMTPEDWAAIDREVKSA
jgi:hypothetical protein